MLAVRGREGARPFAREGRSDTISGPAPRGEALSGPKAVEVEMNATMGLFEVGQEGDTLLVSPTANLGELDCGQIESEGRGVLDLMANPSVRNVVLDFRRTDYCGSTALGLFLRLWKRVRGRGGRMAFCNVSEHEREILAVTKLDGLWPVCRSREEALRVVRTREGTPSSAARGRVP